MFNSEPGSQKIIVDTLREVVRQRKSCRAFQPVPVPHELIVGALEDAQQSPSNCNTQPWSVHIVSGMTRDLLSEDLLEAVSQARFSPDFSFDTKDYFGSYSLRNQEQGRVRFEEMGISRDDPGARMEIALRNYRFFGAPHIALLFMPPFGDCVRVGADVGMYAQTLMLAFAARGIASVPQTSVAMLADVVRNRLNVSEDMKLLLGISFGYADSSEEKIPLGRAALSEVVTFHE